ncbi:hypothetical protein KIK06_15625 [Nocardiopsis sp. EMB25]|nr:hypothetical protein [Nocardiopsis sp. EMB25]MCY9785313.1 hypothetical protein [Nocardiopsis sp. EMB25]
MFSSSPRRRAVTPSAFPAEARERLTEILPTRPDDTREAPRRVPRAPV